MSDDELLDHTKKYIDDRHISGKMELANADNGLYKVLLKRKLIKSVFALIESEKSSKSVLGVVEALDEFGGSE